MSHCSIGKCARKDSRTWQKKYTADQWVECAKAILEKLKEEETQLFKLMGLIELVRKEDANAGDDD